MAVTNDDGGNDRADVIVSGILDNKTAWIGAVASAGIGVWVSTVAGRLQGTSDFYMALFFGLAGLAVAYGVWDIRNRLKRLQYAAD